MGQNNSKNDKQQMPASKPKTMPYKRQFSTEKARSDQGTMYSDFRQNTLDLEEKKLAALTEEEKAAANNSSKSPMKPPKGLTTLNTTKPDILDPKKYKPPPSPATNGSPSLNQPKYANSFQNT